MSRPSDLDLTLDMYPWRDVPMPGANAPFSLSRLDSAAGDFVVHGRFPPGFARPEPGGYAVAEEFLVLEGELTIGDAHVGRGDLTYVPERFLRRAMTTAGGCTVLAWFAGPAVFVPAAELLAAVDEGLVTVDVLTAGPGEVLDLPTARWVVRPSDDCLAGRRGDVIARDLSRWHRLSGSLQHSCGDVVVRIER